MNLNDQILQELSQHAIRTATAAGALIETLKNEGIETREKDTGTSLASKIVTDIDVAVDQFIYEQLGDLTHRYDLGYLSEEREDDQSRFEKDYFWCIDPLDGTLPFVEKRSGYAVSIALVSKDGQSILGVVFDPNKQQLYHAIKGAGAFRNKLAWTIKKSSKKPTPIDRGGAVMNACWVLEEAPASFIKPPKLEQGGGCLWDYAATTCIFHEMGLIATDFFGRALNLNQPHSVFMNGCGVRFVSCVEGGVT